MADHDFNVGDVITYDAEFVPAGVLVRITGDRLWCHWRRKDGRWTSTQHYMRASRCSLHPDPDEVWVTYVAWKLR